MHVRVAWEIYYHQQKQAAEKAGGAGKMNPSELLHPPRGLPHTSSPSMFSALTRPPNLPPHPPSMLGGPSPRFEPSSMLGHSSHLTPSIPGLGGLRYPNPGQPSGPGAPHLSQSFHHPGVTPTAISGPPPGSMFSREGLSYPTPSAGAPDWR